MSPAIKNAWKGIFLKNLFLRSWMFHCWLLQNIDITYAGIAEITWKLVLFFSCVLKQKYDN